MCVCMHSKIIGKRANSKNSKFQRTCISLIGVRACETVRTIHETCSTIARVNAEQQCFPHVSAGQCSPPKTGYQLYRPQFLTFRILLANTSYPIDVLDRYFAMRIRDLSREQIWKILSIIAVNYYVHFYINNMRIKLILFIILWALLINIYVEKN